MAKEATALTTIDRLYGNKTIALSNALAQARTKTNLLESKIEFLAIYRMGDDMKEREKVDLHGRPYSVHYVDITASEIRQLIGSKSGRLYSQIENAAFELKQKLYIYKDSTKNQFKMDNLYGEVSYENGKLSIEFNPATEFLFTELSSNYTKLKLGVAFKFQTNGGFQLYKMLKTHTYVLPDINKSLSQEEQESITKEFPLSDFRLQMGYVNLDQPDIKQEGSKAHPDADKMVELDKKPKYKRWQDFYVKVILPGVEEINRISDIYVSAVEKQCIAHGKVDGVIITVQNNKAFYEKEKSEEKPAKAKPLSEMEKIDFTDKMRTFIKEPLLTRQLMSIAEAANYNIEAVEKAYEISKAGPRNDLVGFLIAAIKGGYEMPVKTAGKTNSFNDFPQRQYTSSDYDELYERKMRQQLQRLNESSENK